MSKRPFVVMSLAQTIALRDQMRPVYEMVIDVLDSHSPNGEAIRDAMLFSRDLARVRIGAGEMSQQEARQTLDHIAKEYMGCKESWKSVIHIAKKGKWAELAETAADYVVGDIEESVFVEAIQRAFQAEVKE